MQVPNEPEVLLDINTTPLIDVLLVLLVMLIVTLPLQLHALHLSLPGSAAQPAAQQPLPIQIAIDAQGGLHWQGAHIPTAALQLQLQRLAQQVPQPALHIRPDAASPYAVFAQVLASAQRLGVQRIAIVGSEQFAP